MYDKISPELINVDGADYRYQPASTYPRDKNGEVIDKDDLALYRKTDGFKQMEIFGPIHLMEP